MKSKNCYYTPTFLEEVVRMCETETYCGDCILADDTMTNICGAKVNEDTISNMVKAVQKWSDEHRERYLSKKDKEFLDMFSKKGDRYIRRDHAGQLWFEPLNESDFCICINENRFAYIDYDERFSLSELKQWEVRE